MGFALAVQIQLLAKTGAAANADSRGARRNSAAGRRPDRHRPHADAARGRHPLERADDRAWRHDRRAPATRGPGPVFAMGAGPSVGFGMSSTPVLLGRVFGALSWQHVSLELAAVVSLPSTTRRADGAGFSQQHLLLSAASCVAVSRWNACLLANAGQVRMVGEDIDRPSSAEVPVVEAGARVAFIQLVGRRVFLNAHADGADEVDPLDRQPRSGPGVERTPIRRSHRHRHGCAFSIDGAPDRAHDLRSVSLTIRLTIRAPTLRTRVRLRHTRRRVRFR